MKSIRNEFTIIRVEASPATGFGHAMRCLAWLKQLPRMGGSKDGIPCMFRWNPFAIQMRRLNCQYNGEMHGKADGEFVSGLRADWVISDGYDFRTSFYKAVDSIRG